MIILICALIGTIIGISFSIASVVWIIFGLGVGFFIGVCLATLIMVLSPMELAPAPYKTTILHPVGFLGQNVYGVIDCNHLRLYNHETNQFDSYPLNNCYIHSTCTRIPEIQYYYMLPKNRCLRWLVSFLAFDDKYVIYLPKGGLRG